MIGTCAACGNHEWDKEVIEDLIRCPKCGSTEASSREPLYGCTYVTCACCGATYWDPTSTKTQN